MYPRHWVAVVCLRFSLNAARPGARRGLLGGVCRGGALGRALPVGWSAWRRSQSGRGLGGRWLVLNLNLNLNLGGAVPCFSWGRLRLVFGGVGTEDEVEGMATAAWVDRLRSHAGERGLVFLGGSAGAGAWGQILHFLFLDEKKQKSRLCIVLNGKIAKERLVPTNSPWCRAG
jgi:hypothetical protein